MAVDSLGSEILVDNDIFDAFRMCLKRYEFKTPTPEEESNKIITRKYY
jgi:hypothetical protein